jgi:predicted anti-sigma-YlaC factor YlaD
MKPMDCRAAKRVLPASLDSELAGPEQERLIGHLAQCPACRIEAERLRDELAALRDLDRPEVPPYLLTRVMAEVRAHRPASRFTLVFGRALGATLAGLAVAAGIGIGTAVGAGLAARDSASPDSGLVFEASDTAAPDIYSALLGSE